MGDAGGLGSPPFRLGRDLGSPTQAAARGFRDARYKGWCSASCPALPLPTSPSPQQIPGAFIGKPGASAAQRGDGWGGGGRRGANEVLTTPLPTPPIALLLASVVRHVLAVAQLALKDSCGFSSWRKATPARLERARGAVFAPGGSGAGFGGDCLLQVGRNFPFPCAQPSLLLL